MTKEEVAKLKPGDWLHYSISFHAEPGGYGVMVERTISATFVKPSRNPNRVVIRPEYRVEAWNRPRAVGIWNVRHW